MKKLITFIILSLFSIQISAKERVHAVGSSTIYPFSTAIAEKFGKNTEYKTPIIESTGTGGGFKLFCEGKSAKNTDIVYASRKIKKSELSLCKKNNINKITELKIGYDGIVIANNSQSKQFNLTKKQLFLALAKYITVNGELKLNPNKKWSDVDVNFPKTKIKVYGPPPTSGTRDSFAELIMTEPCVNDELGYKKAYPVKKHRKRACGIIREDGAYINSGENDNFIIKKLSKNKKSLGIFGFSFLIQNTNNVQASTIDNKTPKIETILDSSYPLSRPLFLYFKNTHLKTTSSLKEFLDESLSTNAVGEHGYLISKGLAPLTSIELSSQRKKLKNSYSE
jgi:phosphate transport system substrate-binding protein